MAINRVIIKEALKLTMGHLNNIIVLSVNKVN